MTETEEREEKRERGGERGRGGREPERGREGDRKGGMETKREGKETGLDMTSVSNTYF